MTKAPLAALVLAVASCSSAKDTTSAWSCRMTDVPLGKQVVCVSSVSSALSSSAQGMGGTTSDGPAASSTTTDGVSDGPAYYCAPGTPGSATCPPPNAVAAALGGTQDGSGAGGGGDQTVVGGGGTADGASSGGATSGGTTSGGTTSGGAATSGGATSGGATSGGTSDGAGGGGKGPGPGGAPGPGGGGTAVGGAGGAGGGAGGTTAGGGSTSDGALAGGLYCTQESGWRTCKAPPICAPGAHVVQMDCEPDQSSGLGGGPGGATGDGYPGAGGNGGRLPGGQIQCFYPAGTPPSPGATPAATFEYVLETLQEGPALHTRLTFSPQFVDNSYGTTAVGWSAHGHQFNELVGSDHAELAFYDTAGALKLHFKEDYLSKSATAPSGYACLGVSGGEGQMIVGSASSIVKWSSSLDRNLNERGYASFTLNSPATNASYAPPAAAPGWDFRVVYEAWIASATFGGAGFGKVLMTFVHASPSKASSNTLTVTPGPCPEGW